MIDQIIKEKISADHLLYVSLKYTKTCDVMINLILRWKSMIELSIDELLKHAKKKKKIKKIPTAPKLRIDKLREVFKKEPIVIETLDLYDLFRKIETLDKNAEFEFRKNVNLKVVYEGDIVNINLDKLKEYAATVERFISFLKQFLSS